MKAITNKNTFDPPAKLLGDSIKSVFERYIDTKNYVAKDTHYKEVQEDLNKIYGKKCAYCEKDLGDEWKAVEHYRPKSLYYWLSLSWDNLLIACSQCNLAKGKKFEIIGTRAIYNGQSFEKVHNIIKELDDLEKPLMINPEQESQAFFNEHIKFHLNGAKAGEMYSENERLQYTINSCKLNREELV